MAENSKYISSLIENTKNGSHKSFNQLVQLFVDGVYSFVNRLLCNHDHTTIMTIDVFRFAADNIHQVRMNSSFIGWLQGIALVKIVSKYRENKESFVLSVDRHKHPMKLSEVDLALAGLDFERRLLLVLHDIRKYSLEEIGDLLPEFSQIELRTLLDSARVQIANGLKR